MGQEKEEIQLCLTYMNSVTIIGFVGANPEQRQAKANGSKFTVLSIATQRSYKNRDIPTRNHPCRVVSTS